MQHLWHLEKNELSNSKSYCVNVGMHHLSSPWSNSEVTTPGRKSEASISQAFRDQWPPSTGVCPGGASEPRSDGTPLSEERRAAVVALPAKSEASTPPAGHSAGSETVPPPSAVWGLGEPPPSLRRLRDASRVPRL